MQSGLQLTKTLWYGWERFSCKIFQSHLESAPWNTISCWGMSFQRRLLYSHVQILQLFPSCTDLPIWDSPFPLGSVSSLVLLLKLAFESNPQLPFLRNARNSDKWEGREATVTKFLRIRRRR